MGRENECAYKKGSYGLQVGCSVVVFEYARSSRSDSRREGARRRELEVTSWGWGEMEVCLMRSYGILMS